MSERISNYLKANPGVEEGPVRQQAGRFEKSPLQNFLLAEIKAHIEAARTSLETCEPEDLKKHQGKIEAYRQVMGNVITVMTDC